MASRRTRNDPRREETRAALIETAESLFAEHGIDGVSLRQIGAQSGSSNTGVVAYHFGSKESLLEAIFHHRLPAIDQRRGELAAAALDAGASEDMYTLLRALWLPLYEQVNENGMHSYAGFMGALMRSHWGESRIAVDDIYLETSRLGERIKSLLHRGQRNAFTGRMTMVAIMVTGALQLIDRAKGGPDHPQMAINPQTYFDESLRMATAAVQV